MFTFSHWEHINTPLLSPNAHIVLAFNCKQGRLSNGAETVVAYEAKYRLLPTQKTLRILGKNLRVDDLIHLQHGVHMLYSPGQSHERSQCLCFSSAACRMQLGKDHRVRP